MPLDIKAISAIQRGHVIRVRLNPAEGGEQEGDARPAIVVSADTFNKVARTLIIVPLTDAAKNRPPRPYEVFLPAGEGGTTKDSLAIGNQVRTIDKFNRVVNVCGVVSSQTMGSLEQALLMSLGITGL